MESCGARKQYLCQIGAPFRTGSAARSRRGPAASSVQSARIDVYRGAELETLPVTIGALDREGIRTLTRPAGRGPS